MMMLDETMFRFFSYSNFMFTFLDFSFRFDFVHTMFYFVLFFRFKLPLKVSIEFLLLVSLSLLFCFKGKKRSCFDTESFQNWFIGTVWLCVFVSVASIAYLCVILSRDFVICLFIYFGSYWECCKYVCVARSQ